MDRDINAAKNIFLKNYEALGLGLVSLEPSPCSLVTDCCTGAEMSSLIFENVDIVDIVEV
jgi:transposase